MRRKIKYENVFHALLVLFVVILVLSESQFTELGTIGVALKLFKFAVMAIIAAFSIIRNKSIKRDLFITTGVLIAVLVFNLVFNDGGLSIIPLVMLVWSSKHYSIEKDFRYTFTAILLTYIFVMVCSVAGILKDEIQFVVRGSEAGRFFAGEYNRHNFGFLVHNQVAIAFFVLYMLYIAIKKDKIRWYESVIIMVLNFLILRFFGSRIVFVLTVLACIGYYLERALQKHYKRNKVSKIPIIAFPLCCILSFLVATYYTHSSRFFIMLDKLLSNRVRLSNEALSFYGIHLLGAGQYAGTYNSTVLVNNTVDNGYISFFIQNGLIVGVIVVGIWTYLSYSAIKSKNRYLSLTLVMIAIENIVNPHLGSHLLIPYFCILANIKDPFVGDQIITNNISKKKEFIR